MSKYLRLVVLLFSVAMLTWILYSPNASKQEASMAGLQPSPSIALTPTISSAERFSFPQVIPFTDTSRSKSAPGVPQVRGASITDTPTAEVEEVEPTLAPTPTFAITITPSPSPTVSEDPAIEALRELQNQNPAGSLFGGARDSKAPQPSRVIPATATVNTEPTPTPALPRVGGMSTGYTMLYLMHPRARLTVERQIDALLKANLNEVYLGAMVDGTFSLDFDYLDSVIRRLAAEDRAVTLVLYFSNGSAMRSYDRTPINVGFNLVPPDAFRAMIEFDSGTRVQFQQMVSRAIPSYDLNRALNPRSVNVAIVMLEDNLDQDSYRAMRDLARFVLGDRAEIVRNPCPGCFPGNDAITTDSIESHSPEAVQGLTPRDGFSLDGSGYELPGDPPNQQLSLDTIRQLKSTAISRNLSYFGLWRKQRQGLGDTLIHPNDRNYEVPSDLQLQTEVDLLRWGLDLMTPTPEPSDDEE